MFKVTVLKMKDIIKFFIGMVITTIIILALSKNFIKKSEGKNKLINLKLSINSIIKFEGTDFIDKVVPTIANLNQKSSNKSDREEKNILHEMLNTEIASMHETDEIKTEQKNDVNDNSKEKENQEEQETEKEAIEDSEKNNDEKVELAKTGLSTEIITNNPISDNSNVQYGNIKIKNETSYNLTDEILNPDIKIDNKNIILFHTHSCESYTPSEKYPYVETGNFRTTDLDFTVTRVGTELENQLKQYKYNVIHSTDYHDYPTYNGSYTRSLATVEKILETTPADIIIDVHRDAIGSRSDYAPTVKIGDDEVAQIMFVIGTDEGGLKHPNWQQNLKFAVKIQQKAEELYPGLFKTMMVTKSRYNQHTSKYANIMEVGATGNTLEQCLNSMKYLAKVMNEVLK